MTEDVATSFDLSLADVRRAIRSLPPERRRGFMRAVRQGRAVPDPRDAPLAVAWTELMLKKRWPGWALPRTKPHGAKAVLWLLHGLWILAVLVGVVVVPAWQRGGFTRWFVVGGLVYCSATMPWILALILRLRWNAPEAERRNRALIETSLDQ